MNDVLQRLQIAQDLIQSLVNAISQATPASRASIQGILDNAAARVKALETTQAPLVVPSLVPPAAKT